MKDFDIGNQTIIENLKAVNQSVYIRLMTVRGEFIYDKELGSRLRELFRFKPSHRRSLAKSFVQEALAPEENLTVLEVTAENIGTDILITVYYEWEGYTNEVEVRISE